MYRKISKRTAIVNFPGTPLSVANRDVYDYGYIMGAAGVCGAISYEIYVR
jgi:hypothetical protein